MVEEETEEKKGVNRSSDGFTVAGHAFAGNGWRGMSRRQRSAPINPPGPIPPSRCRALVLIDDRTLREAAWRELGAARRRLEKATRDLHRHEGVDVPGFRAWLGSTFPQAVTASRELAEKVARLGAQVNRVQAESFYTGRSARAVWREMQRPPAAAPEADADDEFHSGEETDHEAHAGAEDFSARGNGVGERDPDRADDHEARSYYRRMANALHPDRGGPWTPAREALWHEVQRAWAARDVDWLIRLEAEWDMHTEVLGPQSSISRLRHACREAEVARRDAETTLREYRQDPAWRFSLKTVTAGVRQKILRSLEDDVARLRAMATHLDQQIAAWDRPTGKQRRQRNRDSIS